MANDIMRFNDRNGRRDLSLFDDFFDSMLGAWDNYSARVPAVDVEETPDEYVVKAEMPGFSEEDVKITVDKHVLRISGKHSETEKDGKGRKYLIRERRMDSFERSFSLPEGVDEGAISAGFKDGVLTVTLPKTPEEKPRQIEVKINRQ